jgi:polyisoprenoid-binding protein YceI
MESSNTILPIPGTLGWTQRLMLLPSVPDNQRDTHLKRPDFLHAEQFPTITFKSKRVVASGNGESKITGDLTIHGVTQEVVLNVDGRTAEGKDPFGNTRVGASASTRVKRSDFGLTWNAPWKPAAFSLATI